MEKQRWEDSENRKAEERTSEKRKSQKKKMQAREKAEKSPTALFFPVFCDTGTSKRGSLKWRKAGPWGDET